MTTPPAEFLLSALHFIAGYHYGRGTAPRETDCCRYVEDVLMAWLAEDIKDYPGLPADLNVHDAARPWSPIEACERMGIALETGHYVPAVGEFLPDTPGVYVCQGWRDVASLKGGHTFFIWVPENFNPFSHPAQCFEATTAEVPWARSISVTGRLERFTSGVRWARVST